VTVRATLVEIATAGLQLGRVETFLHHRAGRRLDGRLAVAEQIVGEPEARIDIPPARDLRARERQRHAVGQIRRRTWRRGRL
jgi:hypothetical protein